MDLKTKVGLGTCPRFFSVFFPGRSGGFRLFFSTQSFSGFLSRGSYRAEYSHGGWNTTVRKSAPIFAFEFNAVISFPNNLFRHLLLNLSPFSLDVSLASLSLSDMSSKNGALVCDTI